MTNRFDQIMAQADNVLFRVFGDSAQYRSSTGCEQRNGATVIISRNVEIAGADGLFRLIQHLAEIRTSEIPSPTAGSVITVDGQRYRLDERIRTDGLVEYWSLLPEL